MGFICVGFWNHTFAPRNCGGRGRVRGMCGCEMLLFWPSQTRTQIHTLGPELQEMDQKFLKTDIAIMELLLD